MRHTDKGFHRLLLISGILSLVLLSGSGSMKAQSGDNKESKIIQWSQKEINIKGSLGDSYIIPLQFKSENYLSNVSLWVVPELLPFISVFPSNFSTISTGSNYMVNIKITIPYNYIPGYYEGTIHVRENSSTIPETLKVVIDTRPRIVDRVSANIPASTGGIITITKSESIYSNGFELVIPPLALPQDTTITVGDVTRNIPPSPENMVPIGLPINIEPDGLTLNKPAIIKIPYSDEMLLYAGVSSPNQITLKTFNTVTGMWEDVPVKEIDTVNKHIIAEINHFSIRGLFSWFENLFFDKDPATDDKIIDYVVNDWNVIDYIKTTYNVIVTVDDIQQVLESYPVPSIPYKSEIGGILTVIDMMQEMDAKDYAEAAKTGVQWLTKFGLKEAGYTWLSAYTGIGFAMWNYFDWFATKVDEAAFNGQINCYVQLRQWGYSHDQIVSGQAPAYSPDGYLWCPGTIAVPRVTGKFTPEDVFRAGKAIWEARESDQYRTQDETNIKDSFIQALLDKKASSNPKADFSIAPGNTGNPPFIVTLNASSSEGKDGRYIVKYEWDLGDGSLTEGVEVTKTYTTPKSYNVSLTVYDDANNSSTVSKSVYVTLRDLTNQAPIADFTYQRNLADPFTINFDASSSYDPDGNIMQYRWSFGDSSIAYGVSPSNTYAAEGNYTVQLVVTDDKLQSTTIIKTIAIDTTPPSVPTGLTATASSSSQINLSWSASTDNVVVAGYKIYRDGAYLKSVTTTSTSDTGLSASTQYCYTVSAYDAAGNESAQSSSICTITNSVGTTMSKLPDTGQADDYTATFGEDSDYTINQPSYTDNGNGTITDNVTGLVWQKQDDGVQRDWNSANTYCAYLDLAGQTDWRLPSRIELIGIGHYGIYSPAINSIYFLDTVVSWYWSSTTLADYAWGAYGMNFTFGHMDYYGKTYSRSVRCVRGGSAAGILTDNGNGTVTDSGTNLTWQQGENSTMTWEAALSHCEGLSLAGQTDWRLPNVKELSSIIDDTRINPAINTTLFPNATSSYYWSSTTSAYDTSLAWFVDFSGSVPEDYLKTNSYYVRCVRGGYNTGTTPPSSNVTTWVKTYGNAGNVNSIQQTLDGEYIVAGSSIDSDALIFRLDQAGNIRWQKKYGGRDYMDNANSIQQISDNGFVVAGVSQSFLNNGSGDYWIFNLDSNGLVQWQKTYGLCCGGQGFSAIERTDDGGFIAVGSIGGQWWIVKVDSIGNIQWQKTCNYGYANSIIQTNDNGYIIAGTSYDNLTILKLDSSGNIQWQKTYGTYFRFGGQRSIQQTSDGGYIIAAEYAFLSWSTTDILVLKLDSDGNIQWQKTYGTYPGSVCTHDEKDPFIQQTADNGFVMTMASYACGYGGALLTKLDSMGNEIWSRYLPGYPKSVRQTNDGGYIVAGNIFGSSDIWIAKLNEKGNDCAKRTGTNFFIVSDATIAPVNSSAILLDSNSNSVNTTATPVDTTFEILNSCL